MPHRLFSSSMNNYRESDILNYSNSTYKQFIINILTSMRHTPDTKHKKLYFACILI